MDLLVRSDLYIVSVIDPGIFDHFLVDAPLKLSHAEQQNELTISRTSSPRASISESRMWNIIARPKVTHSRLNFQYSRRITRLQNIPIRNILTNLFEQAKLPNKNNDQVSGFRADLPLPSGKLKSRPDGNWQCSDPAGWFKPEARPESRSKLISTVVWHK